MTKRIELAIFFSLIAVVLPRVIFGIGQMSEPIIINDALRSQEMRETISVTNSENKKINIQLNVEGQIADWATFYEIDDKQLSNPITKLTLPELNSAQATVLFKIPIDVPNGTYTGAINAISMPLENSESSINNSLVTVGQKIGRDVTITITDNEIFKMEASVFPLQYEVPVGRSLDIKAIYNNQGNVAIKPEIQLKISNIDTGIISHNAIYPYPENEKPIRAFEAREFPEIIKWQTTGQPEGKYHAYVKVMLNGDVIKEENFQFDIISAEAAAVLGANTQAEGGGETGDAAEAGQNQQMIMWSVLGVFVALGVFLLTFKLIKR